MRHSLARYALAIETSLNLLTSDLCPNLYPFDKGVRNFKTSATGKIRTSITSVDATSTSMLA